MRLFQKKGETNEPMSLEKIQRSLNWCARYNGPGSTTDLEHQLRDQLEQLGYQAEYQDGYNTYEIKPLTYYEGCSSCSGKCTGH